MADVRNGDDQAESAGALLGPDGVVEIAGILAVDGHERHLPQVLAPGERRGRHLAAVAACLGECLRRKRVRQAVRGDRKVDRRVGTAAIRKDAQHAPDGVPVPAWLFRDLDDREVPVPRRPGGLARDDDALADAPVVRRHESDAAFEREAAGDLPCPVLEHLDDRALGPSTIVATGHATRGAVSMEQHPHFAVREEQVVAAVVGHEEAEAVAMTAHRADDDREPIDQAIFVGAIDEELPFARHCAEPLRQRLALRRLADAELRCEGIEAEWLLRLRQLCEQKLAAWNRFRVALGLVAKTRVFLLPARLATHRFPEIDIDRVPA